MEVNMPLEVKGILNKLNDNGYEAYIVGGCVRDSIIGNEPHDWDICTSATPDEIIKVFSGYKIIPTGLKHGTVTITINAENYEITTYRIDGEYEDSRHPKKVEFTKSLEEDLSRRDFTINAMAYNDIVGLVDLFGGEDDIKCGIIRCVGNPDDRFQEDALRIMRALRFAARFGFKIDASTYESMNNHKKLLHNISKERINSELTQLLMYRRSDVYYLLCYAKDIMIELFGFTKEVYLNNIEPILYSDSIREVRIAFFFTNEPHAAKDMLVNMKYDNKTISTVFNILTYAEKVFEYNPSRTDMIYFVKKMMNEIGYEDTRKTLFYCVTYASIKSNDRDVILYENMQYNATVVDSNNDCYKISQLALNGNDIKHFGYKGEQIGTILYYLLDMVMKGNIENTKESLTKRLEELGEV